MYFTKVRLGYTAFYFFGIGLVLLVLAFISLVNRGNEIHSVTISSVEGAADPASIALPYSALSNPQSRMVTYSATIVHKFYGPTKWQMIADDCIRKVTVNQHPVDLTTATGNPCDINNGIVLDLQNQLASGVNAVDIVVEDFGGSYAFKLKLTHGQLDLYLNLSISVLSIACFCYFLRCRKVDYPTIGLFIISAILSLHYLHISNNGTYTNDLGWHLGYITYVSQHWLSPYGYSPWTVNHPPFYYYVAAALSVFNKAWLGMPEESVLRFLSWLCFLIFHCFNVLTLRRSALCGIGYYAAATLLLLWPGNAHLASKINSEAMYYAIAAITFYYTIVWYQAGKSHHLMVALLMAGVASMVRTNAVTIFCLIGAVVLVTFLRRRLKLRDFLTKRWVAVGALVLLCIGVCFGGLVVHGTRMYSTIPTLEHPFKLTYYLSPNPWFESPFNTWSSTNQSFLEVMLKTSMMGEYEWQSPTLAIAMKYFVVAIFWYTMVPWFFATRAQWRGLLPHAVWIVSSIVFLVSFSLYVKDYASQDARYIYPVLISFVVFFGKSHAMYKQRGALVLSWLGPLLAIGFTGLSTYYFWYNFR